MPRRVCKFSNLRAVEELDVMVKLGATHLVLCLRRQSHLVILLHESGIQFGLNYLFSLAEDCGVVDLNEGQKVKIVKRHVHACYLA